jgi:Pyridoxal-dependent decarboxylase conserved domain
MMANFIGLKVGRDGLGRNALRVLPTETNFQMWIDALEETIARDKKDKIRPMCIVGMFGTKNTGAVDDIRELRRIADHGSTTMCDRRSSSIRWPRKILASNRPRVRRCRRSASDSEAGLNETESKELHAEVAQRVEQSGRFWMSTTELKSKTWFRINPVNFRTRQ